MGNDRSGNRLDEMGGGEDLVTNSSRDEDDAGQSIEAIPDGGATVGAATQGSGEAYCHSCGVAIPGDANVCPQCGVEQESGANDGETSGGEPSGRYLAAFAGGIVSFFVGWIPLIGPAIGGVVAGYLRGSDTKESAISGLVGNVLAAIPMMGLAALFLLVGGLGAASQGDSDVAIGLVLWAAIFAGSFVYFFGLGAVGGALGAKLTSRRAP